ncbi:hypothetical protein AB0D10_05060 [Kitasatospora sp. NPDC048545]|uniref:hypothetical protein n=1 Tax=Kitasatospora sp. NPDC048545 TaxID=3157208 RepID=UPI003404282B
MAAKVTASKKAPARRPAPSPAARTAEPDFEVLRLTTSQQVDEERVPLFYIDDVEYCIPKRPRMNIALQYMHLAKDEGDAIATDYLLGSLLGEDGYRALREYDQLTPEQFQQITVIATRQTLGALEFPKA